MKTLQGFKIGHRFFKIFKWIILTKRIQTEKRQCLTGILNPITKIYSLACGKKPGQTRFGNEPKSSRVPKGYLVVNVGESNIDTKRVVVPVIYFNHPLFGELLEQAERVYGFDQPGRIMIPCRVSDFEKVQMKISNEDCCMGSFS